MGDEMILPKSMEDVIFIGCSGLGVGSIVRAHGKRIKFVSDEEYEQHKLREEIHCYQGCLEINPHLARLCLNIKNYSLKCPTCQKYRGEN